MLANPPSEPPGLYDDLKREYDLILDRSKTLTGQAANLTSFAGIVQTVLVALLITLATSKDARAVLLATPYFPLLAGLVAVGFFSYAFTAGFALLAFRERLWIVAPAMPDENPVDSVKRYFREPGLYERRFFALQLGEGIRYHQQVNKRKYNYLRVGLIFLVVGIVATGIGGIILLLTLL